MINGPQREALRLSPEEARLVERMRQYRMDLPLHGRQCLQVIDKESRLRPLVLNEPQMIIHAKLEAQRAEFGMVRAMILKGRKQGACLAPDTRVVMADLTWRRIDDVRPGDRVLSLDEESVGSTVAGRRNTRRMRVAVVQAKAEFHKEMLEISLSNGTTLRCTGDHRWLVRQRGGVLSFWRHAQDMRVGDYLRAATYAPDDAPITLEDGWVGGVLDGDGSCAKTALARVQFTQVAGAVLDRYREYLRRHGLGFYESVDTRTAVGTRYRKFKDTHIHNVRVDRFVDIAKLLSRTRPIKFDIEATYTGRKMSTSCPGFEAYPRITSIRSVGVGRVIDIQTSERTFVAEGIVSHNSTYIGARFYHKTRLWKHRRAKVMAHDQASTDVLFNMVRTFYNNDPLRLQHEVGSAKQFVFSNQSSYTVGTAGGSGEAGRGDTPTLAHMSEAAFYKNPEKNIAGFASSVPMANETEIIMESTANGIGNEFHTRWSRAEARLAEGGESISYIPIFIPWFLSAEYRLPVPSRFELRSDPEGEGLPSEREIAEMYGLDMEQMAWRRFYVGDHLAGAVETFMQEFPCTPAEAFQKIGVRPFIQPKLVALARRRTGIEAHGPRILGVDPAGMGGDKFAMTLRQGHVVHWHRSRVGVEPGEEQVEWVADIMRTEGVDRVNIDYSGGWGTSLLAGMRERYPRLGEKCYPVDFGSKSQFKQIKPHAPGPRNRRAEMYMRARDWFELPEGVTIPDENELQGDLSAVTARISGQTTDTLIESKIEIRKLLQRSPDVADSFVLTFAFPDRTIQTSLTAPRRSVTPDVAGSVTGDSGAQNPYSDPWVSGVRTGYDSGGGWMV